MDRIARHDSFDVVYFQHGVVDSSFSWIVHGPKTSLAYKAYNEKKADIFMGNFRGVYPRKVASWRDPKKSYWDYTCDDYVLDVQAFIERIVEVKTQEMAKSIFSDIESIEEVRAEVVKRLKITYIGHSMGGMTLTMYVVRSRLENKPHYLSKAILLSPAGYHKNAPLFIQAMGWSFENVLGKFIDGVGAPAFFNSVLSKLHKDFQNMPACKDLITYMSS